MLYRKFRADYLFTGREMLDHRFVLIADQAGNILEVIEEKNAGDDVEKYSGILCPGFINCHCHLELSHLKGVIPEGTGMVPFLLSVMNNRNVSAELAASGMERADRDMYNNGIAAVGDICNSDVTLKQKSASSLYYHSFVETLGFSDQTAEVRFQQSLAVYDAFARQNARRASLAPHAPYSVSATLFKRLCGFTGNALLTMHNQESEAENEFFRHGTGPMTALYQALGIDISGFRPSGCSSFQTVLPAFSAAAPVILAHNVATGKEDLEWMAKQTLPPLYWCLCPNANLYIAGLLPDIGLFKAYNLKMTLGTDSLASNHQLDILDEIKTLMTHFPDLKLTELLSWATLNGAEALGIAQYFGSFEKGKRPGVTLIEGSLPASGKARRLV